MKLICAYFHSRLKSCVSFLLEMSQHSKYPKLPFLDIAAFVSSQPRKPKWKNTLVHPNHMIHFRKHVDDKVAD